MNVSGIVANQVLIMFLLIGVGVLLDRIGMVTQDGSKQLTAVLSYVVSPALIVVSYQRDYTPEGASALLWCFGLALVTHLVGIGISALCIRKSERWYPNNRHRIAQFGAIYSNGGFFAYPLLMAVFGSEGIFYGVAYTGVFLLSCWTHGVVLLNGKMQWKQFAKLLLNPAIIGVLLGLFLYFTGWRLPGQVNEVLSYLGDLNTPVAMLIIGCWFSRADWKRALRDWTVYFTSALRLLVIPLVMIGLYSLLPLDQTVRIAAILPAAAPIAANTAMLPALYGLDKLYGTQLISISTLLALITLPMMVALAQMIG